MTPHNESEYQSYDNDESEEISVSEEGPSDDDDYKSNPSEEESD